MMNQFAKLLSTESQTAILLDTCTIVSVLEKKPAALEFRKKIALRKDIRIVVPSILAREVARVAGIGVDEAIPLIESFSQVGQIDYVTRCEDDDGNRVAREADALKAKYLNYCHYPDNHYIVHCRDHAALLVTYDNDLRRVARMEGVMTCSPGNFRLYN